MKKKSKKGDLDKFLSSMPPSMLKALKGSDSRVKYLAQKFNVSDSAITDRIDNQIKESPSGAVPATADLDKMEKSQNKIEEEFFNEPDEKSEN